MSVETDIVMQRASAPTKRGSRSVQSATVFSICLVLVGGMARGYGLFEYGRAILS